LNILAHYRNSDSLKNLLALLRNTEARRLQIKGLAGSLGSVLAAASTEVIPQNFLFLMADKESAAYFFNDLEHLFEEHALPPLEKRLCFFPTAYKKPYNIEDLDNANVLSRSEVINRFAGGNKPMIVVTYPEALSEKVISRAYLDRASFKVSVGMDLSVDFLCDMFSEFGFEREEFVVEPGQFSLRGGIVDVFSYSDDYPYRIEFLGDEIETIRKFEPGTQLSRESLDQVSILPNVHDRTLTEKRQSFLSLFNKDSLIWLEDLSFTLEKTEQEFKKVCQAFEEKHSPVAHVPPAELFMEPKALMEELLDFRLLEFGKHFHFQHAETLSFESSPQPIFHKNFELLLANIEENVFKGYQNLILTDSPKQEERIQKILKDLLPKGGKENDIYYQTKELSLHEGFIDHREKLACYTDHQIFDRFHRFQLRESYSAKEALTIRDLYSLKPGDYVTHIDHGVGRFDGLERIENSDRQQEAIRLIYQNNDILYVSIHSLHRIAKYTGKDGTPPSLNRLGSPSWNKVKENTKRKVKDIAKDLIKLYAERRRSKGFSFSADTYLQHELEASFLFEDTPDQVKATADIKKDLEADFPMDRLICGDVGFGKTEIAVRAAFKAVADSKQVGILVPTTILATQHYKTFSSRLEKFPCRVEYVNRFRTAKEQKEVLRDLEAGKVDILIGTHRILSQDIKFKDLGLLIIDEEQKFGVAAKEKLKKFKVNVDNLTLTATPIPRTLQFSMMGARDLSIISTPPANRQPVQTELRPFNEEVIRDAIQYEVGRGGQVFFVHTRVNNILDVTGMIQRFCPDVRIAIAHGQMDGHKLEKVMLEFIDGEYDVLVATTIIESGLDIPNVNTILINDAHHYGLSDLHQLRGRVGRSNKKAFCYLLAPPLVALTEEARKRLKAIEEFSDLGSGFNIAMRDLDIRGAGNLLGAEQSGFISDIGYEMYLKILDEAMHELKVSEFPEMLEEKGDNYVRECSIETDLEILIPDEYVSQTIERLNLYKELDSVETEEGVMKFQEKLIDRFGPVPRQTTDLFNALRLRWIGKELGFEKLLLKNHNLTGYFVSNPESAYYESAKFTKILDYVTTNPSKCKMKEGTERLSLSFTKINTIDEALLLLRNIAT